MNGKKTLHKARRTFGVVRFEKVPRLRAKTEQGATRIVADPSRCDVRLVRARLGTPYFRRGAMMVEVVYSEELGRGRSRQQALRAAEHARRRAAHSAEEKRLAGLADAAKAGT